MASNLGVGFVALHVGAGYHSPANGDLYKQICRQACLQAMNLLKAKKTAYEAAKAAIIFLEDSPWTNAGTGSNLTLQGTVECDASIMDGASLQYGAVGAVSGIRNPILIAGHLLETQKKGNLSLGRIPPCTLVGEGAKSWAVKNNISTVKNEKLLTECSKKAFVKHKRKLDMLNDRSEDENGRTKHKVSKLQQQQTDASSDNLQDTVGVICVDGTGMVVSAVSSGGIVLKQPGRIGQAALYGCGCWAENNLSTQVGIGVSTSGCGEHLTKTLLARECADCIKHDDNPTMALSNTFKHKFLESPFIQNVSLKLGGALVVKSHSDSHQMEVEVLWTHSTDSMCLAYMESNQSQPTALISRLPEGKRCGQSYVVQSKHFTITL